MSAWSDTEVSYAMDLLSCCASDWTRTDVSSEHHAGVGYPSEVSYRWLAWLALCHALYQPWIDHGHPLAQAHCYAEAQALLACGWRPERP